MHIHPADLPWLQRFRTLLRQLDHAPAVGTQLALVQVDDVWHRRTRDVYVACPDRGRHDRLADCWLCWSDVTARRIPAHAALRPGVR